MNMLADRLSQKGQVLPTEWELHPEAVNILLKKWGPSLTNLFATQANKKCLKFISPFPDQEALAIDGFRASWENLAALAYPPQTLMPMVLTKNAET